MASDNVVLESLPRNGTLRTPLRESQGSPARFPLTYLVPPASVHRFVLMLARSLLLIEFD